MKVLNYCKIFYSRLWPKRSKKRLSKYYRSVHTLPIYNWLELNKTGDLTHLLLNPSHALDNDVINAYYAVKNEFFELFGVPEDYKKHLKSLQYYGLLMAKYLESGGQAFMLTHIEIARLGLDLDSEGEPFDYAPMWAAVISRMATIPNIKKMTTFDFMSIYTSLTNG